MEIPRARAILAVLGLLLLGGIGSGVWDVLLKPVFFYITGVSVSIGTLGIQSLRDSVYADIARGPFDRPSLYILCMAAGLLLGVQIIVTLKAMGKRGSLSTRSAIKSIVISAQIVFATLLLMLLFRVYYVTVASENVNQLQTIIAPYVNEDQRLQFASRLAVAKTRDEYVSTVEEMESIALQHGLSIDHLFFL
jgi:hypothetical protein